MLAHRLFVLTAGMLALPTLCLAQPVTGPYVSLGAGGSIFQDQSVKSASIPSLGVYNGGPGSYHYAPNGAGAAALGWGFGNGFRAEVSGLYERNTVDDFGGIHGSGRSDVYGGFLNGLYDFNIAPLAQAGFVPYIGAGAGYLRQSFRNAGSASNQTGVFDLNAARDGLGVDGIAGVAYNIDAVPGLAITAEYRFVVMPHGERYSGYASVPGFGSGPLEARASGVYSHTALLGVRYALWQPPVTPPPPPPEAMAPPAPPPAPVVEARTYLVFFDWDRADLTQRARQIVADAAANSTRVSATRIEVDGYTDTSGTAAYNQKLSVRRAQSVRVELVKDGVADASIDIHGYGETKPLVPTGAGVREPQNRRVEIILK